MSTNELEARLLYSIIVAGKSASFAENALRRLNSHSRGESPFAMIRRLVKEDYLRRALELARAGNYGKLARSFNELAHANLDLCTCSPQELEAIHGIGPKTSRFFIIWTRPKAKHAALDTHVLKWLRFIGVNAPKSTPSGEKYAKLELIVLAEAEARAVSPRDLDADIWDWCSTGRHLAGEWPAQLQPRANVSYA